MNLSYACDVSVLCIDHLYGITLEKIGANINAESTPFAPFSLYVGVVGFVGVHECVRLWTEECALFTVVFTAFITDHLSDIIHSPASSQTIVINNIRESLYENKGLPMI